LKVDSQEKTEEKERVLDNAKKRKEKKRKEKKRKEKKSKKKKK